MQERIVLFTPCRHQLEQWAQYLSGLPAALREIMADYPPWHMFEIMPHRFRCQVFAISDDGPGVTMMVKLLPFTINEQSVQNLTLSGVPVGSIVAATDNEYRQYEGDSFDVLDALVQRELERQQRGAAQHVMN